MSSSAIVQLRSYSLKGRKLKGIEIRDREWVGCVEALMEKMELRPQGFEYHSNVSNTELAVVSLWSILIMVGITF